MTTFTTRVKVGPDGLLRVPLAQENANAEVVVTISSASEAVPTELSKQDWLEAIGRTAGSIPDFQILPEAMIDPIPPLDLDE